MVQTEARYRRGLTQDLQNALRGDVTSDTAQLSEVAQDFGGLVCKTPAVVVRPRDSHDVSRAVVYAITHDLPIGIRAAGHSQGGQSLSDGGILLDMRGLDVVERVDSEGLFVEAGSGTVWRDAVRLALGIGLVPPVLTNNFSATLGGTHSTGGIGTSSFRYGSQAQNCLALEVVTGDGEIVRCSPSEREDLFHHLLCGLGQFGVLTKVKHALRRHRSHVRTDTFVYDDVGGLVEDMRYLVEEGRVDHLDAYVVRRPRERTWLFPLRLTSEVDAPDQPVEHHAPHAYRHVQGESTAFGDFVLSPRNRRDPAWGQGLVRPWIDTFLPWDKAQGHVEETVREMPEDVACSYALRPFRPARTITPMLAVPEGETCLGFGVFPVVPREDAAAVLDRVEHVRKRLVAGGGKRYLSGWNGLDSPDWRSHYGPYWVQVQDAKHLYDPHGVLGSDGNGRREHDDNAGRIRSMDSGDRQPEQHNR